VDVTVTFGTSVAPLPVGTDPLTGCLGDEGAVGTFRKCLVFVVPRLFGWTFDDGHGMGVGAEAHGAGGKGFVGVCFLA
jgi:hypothetical protein